MQDISLPIPLEVGKCLLSKINRPLAQLQNRAPRSAARPWSAATISGSGSGPRFPLSQLRLLLPPCTHLYSEQAQQLHAPAALPRDPGQPPGPRPLSPPPPTLCPGEPAARPEAAYCSGFPHPQPQARQTRSMCSAAVASPGPLRLERGAREAWPPRPWPAALLRAGEACGRGGGKRLQL